MASPLGHLCAGVVVRAVFEERGWLFRLRAPWWRNPITTALVSVAPDLDIAVSLLLTGSPVKLHQRYTHNLAFALAAGILLALLAARKDRWRAFLWGGGLVVVHLLLDAAVGPLLGRAPTLGIPLFWPLTDARFGLPIAGVPMLYFGTPDQIVSWRNGAALAYEFVVFGLPLLALAWWRRKLPANVPPAPNTGR